MLDEDDFGVKCVGEKHTQHFLQAPSKFNVVDKNEKGTNTVALP